MTSLKTIVPKDDLVDLLNGGSGTSLTGPRCCTSCSSHTSHVRHASWSSSCCTIKLGDNRVADRLHLLLLLVELLYLCKLVGVQPLDGFVALVVNSLAVVI